MFCKDLILSGELKADEQIPSVRQLATDMNINPNTIAKAYAELERLGVVYSAMGTALSSPDSILFFIPPTICL